MKYKQVTDGYGLYLVPEKEENKMGNKIELKDVFMKTEDGEMIPLSFVDIFDGDSECDSECDCTLCEDCLGDIDEYNEPCLDMSQFITWMIKDVIFHEPATIVKWWDGTKTVVKCNEGDTFNKEFGLLACIVKKFTGNTGRWNEILKNFINKEDI